MTKRNRFFLLAAILAVFPASGGDTFSIRGIGTIAAHPSSSGRTVFRCDTPAAAQACASKYCKDLLGFGRAKLVSENPTVLKLENNTFCRIGTTGNSVYAVFGADMKKLASETLDPVKQNAHPRGLDRFDNDAVAIGFQGWGRLPKNIYTDFAWARNYFSRFLWSVPQESGYLAPGLWDFSGADWWLSIARRYNAAGDFYLSSGFCGRPTFPQNIVPMPHIVWTKNSHPGPWLFITEYAYGGQYPVPATDPYLHAGERLYAEYADRNPDLVTLYASSETGGVPLYMLDDVRNDPSVRALWHKYLRDDLKYSLADVGKKHYGDARRFRTWNEVPIPAIRDFTNFEQGRSLDLAALKWTMRSDLKGVGEKENFFAVNAPGEWIDSHPNDLLLDIYCTNKKVPAIWLRCEFDLPKNKLKEFRYLHLALARRHGLSDSVSAVYCNGKRISLPPGWSKSSLTRNLDDCFDLGGALKPGKNVLVLMTPGKHLDGHLFLSRKGVWHYPSADPARNRLFFDASEFSGRYMIAKVIERMKVHHSVAPNHPQLVMACSAYFDLLLPAMKQYGGFPHDTGQAGSCYAPWTTAYASPHGIITSSEPGLYPLNRKTFQRYTTYYIVSNNESVNWLWDVSHYRDGKQAENALWLDQNRELMKCIGKMLPPERRLGVMRSVRNASRLRQIEPWDWDVSRGGLKAAGYDNILLDPSDVVNGNAARWVDVLFDAGTTIMTEEEVSAIERFVRQGGVFVALHQTGRHSPEKRDSWPIARLTGMRTMKYIREGRIKFTSNQTVWPMLRDAELNGTGYAINYLNQDSTGASLGMLSDAGGIEEIAHWVGRTPEEGNVAVAVRKLGKGRIITLGGTFWRQAKDEYGRWRHSVKTAAYLRSLLLWCGEKPMSSVNSDTARQQIFAERRFSKNGLYDLYVVSRISQKQEKDLTIEATFHNTAPGELFEISAAGHPPKSFRRNTDGSFTIPEITLAPMQTRIFAAPRKEQASSCMSWLRALACRYSAPSAPGQGDKPEIQKPSPWIIPLVDGWEYALEDAGGKVNWTGRIVRLGTFDAMKLPSDTVARFRKKITLPEAWRSRRLSLVFKAPNGYFIGVFPRGELSLNGKKLPISLARAARQNEQNQAIDLAVPADGELNLELRIDGNVPKTMSFSRPVGVLGMFYLLSNPQPLAMMELPPFRMAQDYGKLLPADTRETRFRYLETRFTVPKDWPDGHLFLEVDQPHGFGTMLINGILIGPTALDATGFRQLLADGLLRRGEENVLIWRPFCPGHDLNQVFSLDKTPAPNLRLAVWPDLPFAPGK